MDYIELLKRHFKYRYVFFSILFLLIIIFYVYFQENYMVLVEYFRNFLSNYPYFGTFAYIMIFLILILLGISTILMSIITGFLFGFSKGFLISAFCINLAAFIAFFITRKLLNTKNLKNDFILSKIDKYVNKYSYMLIKNYTITNLFFLKFVIPAISFSYLSGFIKKIKLKEFAYASLMQNTLIMFIFSYFGRSIAEDITKFIFGIVLLIIFTIASFRIKKYIHNKRNHNMKNQ